MPPIISDRAPCPCDPRTAVLILAAGRSRRLGRPKGLVRVSGRPLVASMADRALASGAVWVGVVTSSALHPRMRAALGPRPVALVRAPRSRVGLSASIRAGVAAVPVGIPRILLVAVDQWAVRAVDLKDLGRGPARRARAAAYAGRVGIPAAFPSRSRTALGRLAGDRGAQGLLVDADPWPLPHAEQDLDTPSDRAALHRHAGRFRGWPR